ncbi:hypothetical protein PFNF54_00805 [Plasmodium falciparum NF54]|uniref:Uncharacterized protein n=1 Tax=Plasmodium falciparum (isolate NF54) TaxID=5843 RepID=W7KBR9_PLAFO|nr:hypothetical protein PFNF54_00805 [Plasmodium falciparum NF54]
MDINVSSIIFQIPNFIRVHFFLNINIKKIKRANTLYLLKIYVYLYMCMSIYVCPKYHIHNQINYTKH